MRHEGPTSLMCACTLALTLMAPCFAQTTRVMVSAEPQYHQTGGLDITLRVYQFETQTPGETARFILEEMGQPVREIAFWSAPLVEYRSFTANVAVRVQLGSGYSETIIHAFPRPHPDFAGLSPTTRDYQQGPVYGESFALLEGDSWWSNHGGRISSYIHWLRDPLGRWVENSRTLSARSGSVLLLSPGRSFVPSSGPFVSTVQRPIFLLDPTTLIVLTPSQYVQWRHLGLGTIWAQALVIDPNFRFFTFTPIALIEI